VTLFDPAPDEPRPGGVHTDDPQTSRDAAHRPANILRWGTQRTELLLVFYAHRDGLTAERAGELCGVEYPGGHRRCSELKRDGLIEDTGTKEPTQRGGEGEVLVITSAGLGQVRDLMNRR
jgi:hypothetical protein